MINNSLRNLGREFLSNFHGDMRTLVSIKHCSNYSRLTPKFQSLKTKILGNTTLSTNHLTPEIKLRLITQEFKIYHATIDDDFDFKNSNPFWGFYWADGQGMSRFILDHPETVKDKKVLDFGSGSGACAIAAMLSGASE